LAKQPNGYLKNIEKKYPEIPWVLMAGMRDKLVHDYDNLDLERIWMTVTQAIPELVNQLTISIDEID
jgi:uncharacterized protein with HEPN domain